MIIHSTAACYVIGIAAVIVIVVVMVAVNARKQREEMRRRAAVAGVLAGARQVLADDAEQARMDDLFWALVGDERLATTADLTPDLADLGEGIPEDQADESEQL